MTREERLAKVLQNQADQLDELGNIEIGILKIDKENNLYLKKDDVRIVIGNIKDDNLDFLAAIAEMQLLNSTQKTDDDDNYQPLSANGRTYPSNVFIKEMKK
jgi:hypothetical protein